MSNLTLTLIQTTLFWEDIDANLDHFSRKLEDVPSTADLVVLPEMFSTGFTMNAAAVAQNMQDSAVAWLRRQARAHTVHIAGSLVIEENRHFYNRLVWAAPDGELHLYDKRHLFRMAGEDKVYSGGNKQLTVHLNGWHIRPFICYDLRFPTWIRNLDNAYDLALFVANWPQPRALQWQTLLKARAIENLSFVVGLNRVGHDGNGVDYSGDSAVIAPDGEALAELNADDVSHTVTIDKDRLSAYRRRFPAYLDMDRDMIRDPSQL